MWSILVACVLWCRWLESEGNALRKMLCSNVVIWWQIVSLHVFHLFDAFDSRLIHSPLKAHQLMFVRVNYISKVEHWYSETKHFCNTLLLMLFAVGICFMFGAAAITAASASISLLTLIFYDLYGIKHRNMIHIFFLDIMGSTQSAVIMGDLAAERWNSYALNALFGFCSRHFMAHI